ncbi:hypothetical protein M0R45_010160 [Rubus argutus]|uniref:BRCT domain-containing protein n=1 Tax=Rubus argutus TaxID=59490 RepID=A0AAW1Y6L3_RUBAR
MGRELHAIDSEFNRVLQDDFCRLLQLQGHTSSPGHPFKKFSWGNKKSLDDEKEKGINLWEQILKLNSDYYHGGLMKLVVIGGESLNVLEQLEAVEDVHILHLAWTLPCLDRHYLNKPDDYLMHLLGHEGRGSLHFCLKARGWVTSLDTCLGGMDCSSVAYVFCVVIYLTDSGLDKIFEIIELVYQYIKLLRQARPKEWIFRERQDIGNMQFRFVEVQSQVDFASGLAENLLRYAPEHVIYGDYAYESWDEGIDRICSWFLQTRNMRVM